MTHAHCPDPYIVDLTKILLRSGIVHIFEKTEVIFISLKSTSDFKYFSVTFIDFDYRPPASI